MPFSEFLEWLEYLRQEQRAVRKQDWYLAQIATEVRRSLVAEPNKVKLDEFLLSSIEEEERDEERMQDEEEAQKSKSIWASFLNIDLKAKRN
jgi:hypothetical protein